MEASSIVDFCGAEIPVSFMWKGRTRGKVFDEVYASVIDILIGGKYIDYNVHLPDEDVEEGECRPLPFSYRNFSILCDKNPYSDMLLFQIDQIKNMTLKLGFFEPGRPIGPIILHPDGRREEQETVVRTDRTIYPKMPIRFDIGEEYKLVVDADRPSPEAWFEKVDIEVPSILDEDLDSALQLLSQTIMNLLIGQQMIFSFKIAEIEIEKEAILKFDFQKAAVEIFVHAIDQVPHEQLKSLAKKINRFTTEVESCSDDLSELIHTKIMVLLYSVVPEEKLREMMKSLTAKGFKDEIIPPQAIPILDKSIAEILDNS